MVYRGIVRNGKVELEGGEQGTPVRIELEDDGRDPIDDLGAEAVDSGIADLSAQHDHYVYGTRKR